MKFDFNKSRFEFIESYHKDYDPLLIDIYMIVLLNGKK